MITIILPSGIKISGDNKDEVLEVYDHLEKSYMPQIVTTLFPDDDPRPKKPWEPTVIYGRQ